MTRVTIFDYGAGNLHSLAKAVAIDGVEVDIQTDPVAAVSGDILILPGVGAFGAAAERLGPGRTVMRDAILSGLPTLGICLGMQLFFATSEEAPGEGLGILNGRVRRLGATRVPHIGWNDVVPTNAPAATEGLRIAYFAHSFVCEPDDTSAVAAWTTHESDRFASMVRVRNAVGVQFHPEKSSAAGVAFVRDFVRGVML
jgi:glutamine amidotransferase